MSVDKLWPFPIEDGSTEVIEYFTSVLKTYTTEQRIKLRDKPRTVFNYTHLLDTQENAYADMLIRESNFQNNFLVPVWSESIFYKEAIDSSDTVIIFDTTVMDLQGGYLFIWRDNSSYVGKKVTSFTDTQVVLEEPVGQNFTNCVLGPARKSYISQPPYKETENLNTLLTITFTSRDNFEVDEYEGYDEFQGLPVYPFFNYNMAPLRDTISQTVEYFDSGYGLVEIEPVRDFVSNVAEVDLFYQGNSRKKIVRSFLAVMSGKHKPFWLPTYRKDITPTSSGSGSSISTDSNYVSSGAIGRGLRIEQNNGNVFYNRVTGVSGGSVSLQSSLPETVGPNQTRSISFMDIYRSETDRFENFLRPGVRGTVTFTAKEVTE